MAAPNKARTDTVLVTGASSGIGQSLARCFASDGARLVLVARSADKLEALAASLRHDFGSRVWVRPSDLAVPGAAATLAQRLKRQRIAVDILVNCAGVLEHGRFADIAPTRHQALIDLNVSGLTAMVASLLPPMLERRRGRILNVASVASFQPVPTLATYAATKAYVLSLTESLAEELSGSGVTVTALCPGITATPMLDGATRAHPGLAQVPGFLVGDVDEVAAIGHRACLAGEVIAVPGTLNQAAALAARATPKWLLRRIAGTVARRMV
jgi:short-subunit dehydrogenase